MTDTKSIRSTLPLAITISEPMPKEFVDKPGLAPVLKTAVIRPGMNNVDSALWAAYSSAEQKPDFVTNGALVEAAEGEPDISYGFQPALDAASKDGAAEGSTIKGPGPVSSVDMKPTSDAPNDDSPRSQTTVAPAPAPAAVTTAKPTK